MSRGPGRIERAIRALFDAHPDDAFTTDTLCAHCYGLDYAYEVERKHRVAVVRAAYHAVARDLDWCVRWVDGQGRELVWFNQASLASTAMAEALRAFAGNPPHSSTRRVVHSYAYGSRCKAREAAQWILDPPLDLSVEAVQGLCGAKVAVEARVADHLGRRAAGTVRAGQAKGLSVARSLGNTYQTLAQGILDRVRFARVIKLHGALATEAAARCRAMMAVNDPDAIRAGLAEIANALDAITAPATPP